MELELQSWKLKVVFVALALLVVAVPLARANHANKTRAEDWHRRAVVAEESVGGLRVVIEQRSRALNERTLQANQLVGQLSSNKDALQQSKVSVDTLTKRERTLVQQNAKIESERKKLQTQQAQLKSIATKLGACTKSLGGALGAAQAAKPGAKPTAAASAARARVTTCAQASANLDTFLGQLP
jgi:chromosome segregation ATPase